MGRRKSTSRKQKVQLKDDKKPEGSRTASNFDYAQMSSANNGPSKIESQQASEDGVKPLDGDEKREGGAVETRLAGFLKEIYELGSREQEGEMQVDNDQGLTDGQSHAESNGEAKVGSEAAMDQGASHHTSQQQQQQQGEATSKTPSSHPSHLEVTFWQEVTDPNTNHVYYWNPETNEVSWTLPPNGVIANEVDSGTGTGQDGTGTEEGGAGIGQGGMGTGKSNSTDGTNSQTVSTAGKAASSVGKAASKKTAKKKEVDIFEGEPEAKAVVGPVVDPSTTVARATVAVDNGGDSTREKGSSKKRKASPSPAEIVGHGHKAESSEKMDTDGYELAAKKQRVSAPPSQNVGGAGESGTTTPPISKHAEQMLRFQVSNVADELSRKLQYLHVSSEGLSDLQVLQIQLQTRLADWKEGGLSSKYMLSKLKQFNVDLEGYERSSAPEGWKFVWDSTLSSTIRTHVTYFV